MAVPNKMHRHPVFGLGHIDCDESVLFELADFDFVVFFVHLFWQYLDLLDFGKWDNLVLDVEMLSADRSVGSLPHEHLLHEDSALKDDIFALDCSSLRVQEVNSLIQHTLVLGNCL